MARTINYWYNLIIGQVNADSNLEGLTSSSNLSGLTSTSQVADYVLWAYIIAICMFALDTFFTSHRADVDADLAAQKAHTARWYKTLALNFQYGQELVTDSDTYANTGLDATAIAAQKIISQAAVVENTDGTLLMKVVKTSGSDFTPLADAEKTAFTSYVAYCKDAGVRVTIESLAADNLELEIDIYYDAMVLDATGARLDGTADTPVQDSGNTYLQNLEFNGEYSNMRLSNALQAVDGVKLVTIRNAQAQYGELPYTTITETYIPDAGYLRVIDGGYTINYIARV